MKKLKEINGKHYQECSVVMLPTKEKSQLCIVKIQNKPVLVNNNGHDAQHLYITFNEEIKSGDWFLADIRNSRLENNGLPIWELKQCTRIDNEWIYTKDGVGYNPEWSKKVIASTDSSLKIESELDAYYKNGIGGAKSLAQPSKQFIQNYIEEYNHKNRIEKVLVEYEKYPDGFDLENGTQYSYGLRINSHNCITIKPIKNSYTREEVIGLLSDWTRMASGLNLNLPREKFDKWVEKNL